MTTPPNRRIPLSSVFNLRDVGGLPTRWGAVRTGELFRSASLTHMNKDDAATLHNLGVRTIYDLRTVQERVQSPDSVEGDVRQLHLDVLADRSEAASAGMETLIHDPKSLRSTFAGGTVDQVMQDSYADIVNLPSARAAYRAFFKDLVSTERTGAALVHCTTGKDRTGWAVASLLLLLGVSPAVVRDDYLQTNVDLLPSLQPIIDNAVSQGVPRGPLIRVLGVQESYIETACSEVRTQWGSIEGYAFDGLGLNDSDIDALRGRFVA